MNSSSVHKALLATFAAQTIWGIAGPLVKVTLDNFPPFSLLFIRSLFATCLLFIIYELKLVKHEPKKTPLDKRNLFLTGVLGVFLNIAFYFWGQKLTTVSDAWIITSSGTIFVVLWSYFFLKERLQKHVYLGIGVAFIGTLVIIGSPLLAAGQGSLLGNILMLGATLAGAASYFLIKDLAKKFSPLVIAYYSFLISVILSVPFFLWEFWQNPSWITSLTSRDYLVALYLILASSIAAYYLSNYGLKRLSASLAATIGYWSPIIAIGGGVIFLKEQLTISFIIGSLLVVVGLILAETRHRKTR